MKETIFFATFSSDTSTQSYDGDRSHRFNEEKTLLEFWTWVQEKRIEIEESLGRVVVVKSIQIIKSGY